LLTLGALGRVRQGYFTSAEEAFLNGYVEVRISVLEGREINFPDPEQGVRLR